MRRYTEGYWELSWRVYGVELSFVSVVSFCRLDLSCVSFVCTGSWVVACVCHVYLSFVYVDCLCRLYWESSCRLFLSFALGVELSFFSVVCVCR